MKSKVFYETSDILVVKHFQDVYLVPKSKISEYADLNVTAIKNMAEALFYTYLPFINKIEFQGETKEGIMVKAIPINVTLEINKDFYEEIMV